MASFKLLLPSEADLICRSRNCHNSAIFYVSEFRNRAKLKGQIRCKMDLGYVYYDNELECLFGSEKAPIDAFLSWLFLADSTKTV